MNHYEIVLLIHPDQSSQVSTMLTRYKEVIQSGQGKVHRLEDWGRRLLSYPIQKLRKAHYLLFNIECGKEVLTELESLFRFNDAVLRNLVLRRDEAITDISPIQKEAAQENERKSADSRPAAKLVAPEVSPAPTNADDDA